VGQYSSSDQFCWRDMRMLRPKSESMPSIKEGARGGCRPAWHALQKKKTKKKRAWHALQARAPASRAWCAYGLPALPPIVSPSLPALYMCMQVYVLAYGLLCPPSSHQAYPHCCASVASAASQR